MNKLTPTDVIDGANRRGEDVCTVLVPMTNAGKHKAGRIRRLYNTPAELDRVPGFWRASGNVLVVDRRHKADWVLVSVLGFQEPHVKGEGCWSRYVPGYKSGFALHVGTEATAFYVSTSEDAYTMSPAVKIAISAVFSLVPDIHYGGDMVADSLVKAYKFAPDLLFQRLGRGKRDALFDFPKSKVSGEHHTHFTPREILSATTDTPKHKYVKAIAAQLADIPDMNEAAAATFMMYMAMADEAYAVLLVGSRILSEAMSVEELSEGLKLPGAAAKALHRSDHVDLRQAFELAVLVNRGVGAVDWVEEREHRVRPDVVKVSADEVYREARNVFLDGVKLGYRYRKLNWDEFVDMRWEWAPTGSVHTQYGSDEKYINKERTLRTKFATVLAMPKSHFGKMRARVPAIRAWQSTKYEWGKQRAIYGTDLTSTVMTMFAMFNCESVLRDKFPVGREAESEHVIKKVRAVLDGSEPFCYDYADFNSQHSIESMQAVLSAYRDVFSESMTDEQREAMEWVIRSVSDMYVHEQTGGGYALKGTLLSGWRLTSFMNTVLNYVYMKLAGVYEHSGVATSLHNGDDVLLGVNTVNAACHVQHRLALIGARAQDSKCNLFSLREFLRIEHGTVTGEKVETGQYLTRACATAVHSRIESQAAVSVRDAVAALKDRMDNLTARGGNVDISDTCLQMALSRLADIYQVSSEAVKRMYECHVIVGGVSTDRWASVEYELEDDIILDDTQKADLKNYIPGIYDYTRRQVQRLANKVGFEDIYAAVKRMTRKILYRTRRTKLTLSDATRKESYEFARALYRRDKGLFGAAAFARSSQLGIPPIYLADMEVYSLLPRLESVHGIRWALRVLG